MIIDQHRGGDPYFADVVLLLHMDGTDGSTTFVDSSTYSQVVFAYGGAEIDTAEFKFGGASGLFFTDGWLGVTDDPSFALGVEDFTIEFWMRPNSFPGTGYNGGLVSQAGQTVAKAFITYIAPNTDYVTVVFYEDDSTPFAVMQTTSIPLVVDTWSHVAITRQASTFRAFVDGVQAATATSSLSIQEVGLSIDVGTLYSFPGVINSYFDGHMDDLRITIGAARYTANFTPPAAAHPDS